MKGFIVAALVLLLILSSTAYGQWEALSFDFTGGGARAAGMGKAYLALSDDVNGLSWNPAGVYVVEKPVLGVSWSSLSPKGATNVLSPSHYRHFEHSGSIDEVTDFSFAAPVRIKGHQFVGSFSYTRSFDAFEDRESFFAGYIFVPDVGDTAYVEETSRNQLSGGANTVNFGFGTRFYGNLSFGVSANIYSGSILREIQTYVYLPDLFIEDWRQSADVEQFISTLDTNKISGVNFTLGLKYAGEKISSGLIVKTPFELKMDFDILIYNILMINDLVEDDGTDTIYFMDNVTKYDMPWTVGLGLAYHASENFVVAADAELRAFKGGKIYVREDVTINPGGDNIETWIELDPRWDNVFTLRLGSEYLWQTGIGTVPLRGGMGLCQMPDQNAWLAEDLSVERSTATCYHFSLGTGLHWEQIRFDASYLVSTIDRVWGTLDYTNRNHHLNLSFTGVF